MRQIKTIIFDLDDTLYDVNPLTELALMQSLKTMINEGLKCSFEQGIEKIKEIIRQKPSADKFEEVTKFFGPYNEKIIQIGKNTYYNAEFNTIEPYPDTAKILEELKKNYKLILVTFGSESQQNKKINALNLRHYFDYILIDEKNNKEEPFLKILEYFKLKPEQVLVIGDRIDSEIENANRLGMKTIRILKGKYKNLEPDNINQEPNYTITNLSEILDILNKKKPKIVAIGGGTGLPTIIEGLRKYTDDLTTIVTVTDSGRSSGILRKELDLLPPGDIRNCIIALSNSEKLMCDLFQYRFNNGSLEGHNFGNLLIAALTKLTGSFEKGIEEASKILKLKGKVLPSTLDNIHICAKLEDNTIIKEEDNIIDRHNKLVHLRSPIKQVFLNPQAKANEYALKEIEAADLIVLCPGSLFTSLITNLLVQGIPEAINKSKAKKVYISNIMSQQSQTHNYKASDHIKKIVEYLKSPIDFIVLNTKLPKQEIIEQYKKENAHIIENDFDEIEKLGIKIITENLLDEAAEKKMLWEKKDLLRHDPDKTAEILIKLLED